MFKIGTSNLAASMGLVGNSASCRGCLIAYEPPQQAISQEVVDYNPSDLVYQKKSECGKVYTILGNQDLPNELDCKRIRRNLDCGF